MQKPPRFVIDGMLGSLARWLRMLGYDADYANQRDDNELVRIARAQGRILLTRDRELASRRGIRALLIESQSLDEQLAQVGESFPLDEEFALGRCSVCNTVLVKASREEVSDQLPAYILKKHEHFQRCLGCGRIYWRGSHWRNMQARLKPGSRGQ
jgi:uncharacterized protein with PIN domain